MLKKTQAYNENMEELEFGRDCWISGTPDIPDGEPIPEEPQEPVEIRIGNLVLKDPNIPELGFKLLEDGEK